MLRNDNESNDSCYEDTGGSQEGTVLSPVLSYHA